MNKDFSEYVRAWDPFGFIEKDGAPSDEYSGEVSDIRLKFESDMTDDEVAELLYTTFTTRFGIDPDNFKEDCDNRAAKVRELLIENDK